MAIRKTDPRGIHTITPRTEVQELFDAMAHALVVGDGAAVAALYESPALIIGDDGVHAIALQDDIASFFTAVKEQYAAQGIVDTRPDLIDLERIGHKIVVATVRWPQLDANGRELAAEASDYTLRRDDNGKLKIRSVLMRGTSPRK